MVLTFADQGRSHCLMQSHRWWGICLLDVCPAPFARVPSEPPRHCWGGCSGRCGVTQDSCACEVLVEHVLGLALLSGFLTLSGTPGTAEGAPGPGWCEAGHRRPLCPLDSGPWLLLGGMGSCAVPGHYPRTGGCVPEFAPGAGLLGYRSGVVSLWSEEGGKVEGQAKDPHGNPSPSLQRAVPARPRA